MKMINSFLERAAKMAGKLPTYERPEGKFTDPRTHEYHMVQIFDHVAHCEVTLPVVMERAEGAFLWDVTGKKYIDFMASYGCANQGHQHPKILDALVTQAQKFPLSSIVTHHSVLGPVAKSLTSRFGYDKILFMNSGSEAVDSAVLTARRWGYQTKKISYGKATVLFPKNCYWGLISSARSGEDEASLREGVEPLPTEALKFEFVNFDDEDDLEAKFKANPNICAYVFEPIQGHAGNIHPKPGYYAKVRELCDKYNVLMVTDEVQSGLGRTGRLFTSDWEGVRPDMITLGKALGGDFLPVSAVIANNDLMNLWTPGAHTSTYSANTLACAVSQAAVDVLFEEKLIEQAEKLGKIVEEEFQKFDYDFIVKKHCGRGLFCSLQMKDMLTCLAVCQNAIENGVLTVAGPGGYLKVMPPLCINESDLREGLRIIKAALDNFQEKGKLGFLVQ